MQRFCLADVDGILVKRGRCREGLGPTAQGKHRP
jgi:hypothetical protein